MNSVKDTYEFDAVSRYGNVSFLMMWWSSTATLGGSLHELRT
jgi:hypothetical protein